MSFKCSVPVASKYLYQMGNKKIDTFVRFLFGGFTNYVMY